MMLATPKGALAVMLTDLAGRTVVDDVGRRTKLIDLAVDLSEGEHPAVVLLLVQDGKGTRLVPAEQVTSFEDPIRIASLDDTEPRSDDRLAEYDLVRRDILDTLIL